MQDALSGSQGRSRRPSDRAAQADGTSSARSLAARRRHPSAIAQCPSSPASARSSSPTSSSKQHVRSRCGVCGRPRRSRPRPAGRWTPREMATQHHWVDVAQVGWCAWLPVAHPGASPFQTHSSFSQIRAASSAPRWTTRAQRYAVRHETSPPGCRCCHTRCTHPHKAHHRTNPYRRRTQTQPSSHTAPPQTRHRRCPRPRPRQSSRVSANRRSRSSHLPPVSPACARWNWQRNAQPVKTRPRRTQSANSTPQCGILHTAQTLPHPTAVDHNLRGMAPRQEAGRRSVYKQCIGSPHTARFPTVPPHRERVPGWARPCSLRSNPR